MEGHGLFEVKKGFEGRLWPIRNGKDFDGRSWTVRGKKGL